jgi:Methyltransferase FkbM domain
VKYEDVEIFGARFQVVIPASPNHTTDEFRNHEPIMEEWVRGIEPGDLVIDAGASFGNYALSAVARGASAVCYEPYHEHAQILRANVLANGWQDKVFVREVGLFDGMPYPEGILKQLGCPLDMPTVRLDDDLPELLALLPPGRLREGGLHIKIDTEGTELGILLGAKKLLEDYHPRLFIEDHQSVSSDPLCEVSRYPERINSRPRMEELLTSLKYTLKDVPWDVSRHYLVAV